MNDALRRSLQRILALFRSRSLDRDVQEELDAHLALAADEHVRRGLRPDEALRQAHIDLGGVQAAREQHRDARGIPFAESAVQDVTFALRGLRRNPGFTFVAVLILALGIGANTAVFSIVNPLLLRELPFPDSRELVWVSPAHENGQSLGTYRVDTFEELKRRTQSFSAFSAYFAFFGYTSYTLTGRGPAEGLVGTMVAPEFFEMLGIRPVAGRFFSAEEFQPNGPAAAVISYGLWQRRFAGNPALVGEAVTINNSSITIVGVLPADFDFGSVFTPGTQVDLFVPALLDTMREWGNTLSVIARLKPDTPLQTARSEIASLLPQLLHDHPEWSQVTAVVTDLKTHVSGRFERSLILLWSAVGLVLLIACANLSNLLLARTTARTREIGVRIALGAGRARVVRQLLTEGITLAAFGAAAGIPLAYGITAYVRGRTGLAVPLLDRAEVDGAALLFTAAAALVTGAVFMAIPAVRASGRHVDGVLREHARGSTDSRTHRSVRAALVASEIALACVLLVGAGLLTRSLLNVLNVELGFQPSRAVAVRLNLPISIVSSRDLADAQRLNESARRNALVDELTARVLGLPGVEAAGLTDALPLDRSRGWRVTVPGQTYPENQTPNAFVYITGPGYMRAMGIPMIAGRDFSTVDAARGQRVVIVNQVLARQLWPDESPLGRTLLTNWPGTYNVVGVVQDVRQGSLEEGPMPQMYFPYTQVPPAAAADLVIRSSLPPAALASSVRAALSTIDPNLMTSELRPIDDLVNRAVSPRRFLVRLIGGFSLLALVLACLGIYGVVSSTVSQRIPELGLRIALGASGREIRRQVLRSTLRVAAIGVAIGTVAAAGVFRVIAALLYETSSYDPATFGGTALLLLGIALAAGYFPALRASRIDPATVLRAD